MLPFAGNSHARRTAASLEWVVLKLVGAPVKPYALLGVLSVGFTQTRAFRPLRLRYADTSNAMTSDGIAGIKGNTRPQKTPSISIPRSWKQLLYARVSRQGGATMDAEYDRIAYDAEQQLNEIRNRHRRDYGQAAIDEYIPCVNQSYLFDMPEDQIPYYRQYRSPEQQQSRADKPGKYRLDPEVGAKGSAIGNRAAAPAVG